MLGSVWYGTHVVHHSTTRLQFNQVIPMLVATEVLIIPGTTNLGSVSFLKFFVVHNSYWHTSVNKQVFNISKSFLVLQQLLVICNHFPIQATVKSEI